MIAMTFCYGTQSALIINMDQTLATLHYEKPGQTTSFIIISAMGMGIISTPLFSTLLKKTLKYKMITILCTIGCFVSVSLIETLFINENDNLILVIAAGSFAGFFLIPSTALLLAYGS
eukprot:GHVR01124109.1.p1 GENE.GHVR01124109.1~~GHVR01124109.1.p1  ORF type:complete len:118 (+),score=0.33 GHVR01124109.1:2798-3151(+)